MRALIRVQMLGLFLWAVLPMAAQSPTVTELNGMSWYGVGLVFVTGLFLGYLLRVILWRLKSPEDYWTSRFLHQGDEKSAAKVVDLRPDSLDLMGAVFRSGFEEQVEAAYQALMRMQAGDIVCGCFVLDVEPQRCAQALIQLKSSDSACLEKIFLHKKLSDDILKQAAQRLVEIGSTKVFTDIFNGQGNGELQRQRTLAAQILLAQDPPDAKVLKTLFLAGSEEEIVLSALLKNRQDDTFVAAIGKGVQIPLSAAALIQLDQGGTRKIGTRTVVELLADQCVWEDKKGHHCLREIMIGPKKGDLIFLTKDIGIYSGYDEIMAALGKRDKSGVIKHVDSQLRKVLVKQSKASGPDRSSEAYLRKLVQQD